MDYVKMTNDLGFKDLLCNLLVDCNHVLDNDSSSQHNLIVCVRQQIEQAVVPLLGLKYLTKNIRHVTIVTLAIWREIAK